MRPRPISRNCYFAWPAREEGIDAAAVWLIGGPDPNAVTREAVKLIDSKLRFGDPSIHEIAIRDTGVDPPRLYVPSEPDRDGVVTDYGLILRAPNPFAADKEIMIIAGSFGHGTVAGTRYATFPAFWRICRFAR